MEETNMEETMSNPFLEQGDKQSFFEPIKKKDDCAVRIDFAEHNWWTPKEETMGMLPENEQRKYNAVKLTVTIIDENVECEHENARPKTTLDVQFNTEAYPYVNKKTGEISKMNRGMLYQLEEAMGFEPYFVDGNGNAVDAFITKTGRKVAPKVPGVARRLNEDFFNAYFSFKTDEELGIPKAMPVIDNWVGKEILASIDIEHSEQYGSKNVVKRFKKKD